MYSAPAVRRHGIPLGRPLGIPVFLAPSWLFISALIVWLTARVYAVEVRGADVVVATDWLIGVAVAVGPAGSVLAHELGHSIVSLALGIPIRRITLFLFGGFAEISRESENPREEYLIAVAGPLVSLLLGGLGGLVWLNAPEGGLTEYLGRELARVNTTLGVLNLLPGLPLDGGRVLRSVVWQLGGNRHRATMAAVRGGQLLAVAAITLGVAGTFSGWADGIFIAMLGAFIGSNATSIGRQSASAGRVPNLRARELARPAVAMPAQSPLAEAVRRADGAWPVAVDAYGRPAGLLHVRAAEAVPLERHPWITLGEVSATVVPATVLPADLSGQAVLDALRAAPADQYLLVEPDGRVAGVLVTSDVVHAVYGDR